MSKEPKPFTREAMAREPMTRKQLAEGLGDLIRAPGAWEHYHIERVARAARKEINCLRKQLADDKRNYPRRHARKSLSKEA
jgi:hypothetical protein